MKFVANKTPPGLHPAPIEIGNVYACHGGRGKGRAHWVVVGMLDNRVTVLGVDETGNVVSGATYARHSFENRPILGRCTGLDVELKIELY